MEWSSITTLWLPIVVGTIPVVAWVLWWWNELFYAVPLKRRCEAAEVKLPPGHMGIPFFGEMAVFLWYFKIRRRPDDFINAKRRKHGDGVGLYRTHLFGSPSIIACSPTINKLILSSNDDFITVRPNVDLMGQNSLIMLHGNAHAHLRSHIMNAINRPNALRRIALLVQPRMVLALQLWAQKGRVKTAAETKRMTFENIAKLFMSMEQGPLLDSIEHLFNGFLKGVRAQPFNLPGTAFHYALQCRKKLEAIFRKELEKKKKRGQTEEKTDDDDVMDGLSGGFRHENGQKMSDQEVIDNVVNLVVGAYESTALASTWAIYYLAKSPDVLNKLREENMAIVLSKKGDYITTDDLSKMEYTNKVVEETIRMANIAAVVFRQATKDVHYKGYRIPKGWKVLLWLRYLHTNPENFEDPMRFNPDRWNEPPRPGTYQAFGGGARTCAGDMLARIQIAIFLHHLSIGYKWKLINPDADILYLSHPVPVDGVEIEFNRL